MSPGSEAERLEFERQQAEAMRKLEASRKDMLHMVQNARSCIVLAVLPNGNISTPFYHQGGVADLIVISTLAKDVADNLVKNNTRPATPQDLL